MAAITVRNISDRAHRALKERAARHERSMEAEVRALIEEAVHEADFLQSWLDDTEGLRGKPLPLPERQPAREPPELA